MSVYRGEEPFASCFADLGRRSVEPQPVSNPDKLDRDPQPSGSAGKLDEKRDESSHLFEEFEEIDTRLAEIQLDVLAVADEMRAAIDRQNRAIQTMLMAQVVVCLVLALLSLKLIGGGQ